MSIRVAPAALALFLLGGAAFAAGPPPHVADYTISVSLDPATKILTGTERLVWRNPSNDAVSELQFHLYLNAFRDEKTVFMSESGGQLRRDRLEKKEENWGWIDVSSMKLGETELAPRFRFLHPDDPSNTSDRTVLGVTLPQAVPPRGEVTLDIRFRGKLPRSFARTGFARDSFFVAQWFPKIGVYETAGTRHRLAGGWNCHQLHANSEFYADFGRYDVSIDVPSRFVVGATGHLVDTKKKGDRTIRRYVQDDVHDFMWAADPNFTLHELRFDPRRDIPAGWTEQAAKRLGVAPSQLALKPFAVHVLLQRGSAEHLERVRTSLNAAIAWYGLYYGPYPYDDVTVVEAPEDAHGSAGVEYPTIFTISLGRAMSWPFDEVRLAEQVTIHEYGHQYWYGLVASNEFEESWLDEGINSYSEARTVDTMYDWEFARLSDLVISGTGFFRAAWLGAPQLDPIQRKSWQYASNGSYFLNSYSKPALALRQMEGDLGEEVFARCLRAYYTEWSFRHPDTRDFFDVFQRVSGRDMTVYRNSIFYGRESFDFAVQSVSSDSEGEGKKKIYRNDALIARTGDMPAGAEVRFRFADGHVVTRSYPPASDWVRYRILYKEPLAAVDVDPGLKNAWDRNLLNNSWRRDSAAAPVMRMESRVHGLLLRVIDLVWGLS